MNFDIGYLWNVLMGMLMVVVILFIALIAIIMAYGLVSLLWSMFTGRVGKDG